MVNSYYLDKSEVILQVLDTEGIVTLFDYLDKRELLALKKKKTPLKKKNNIDQGVYFESSFVFNKIFNKELTWKILQFKHENYIIRHDKDKLKKGTYAIYNLEDWDNKAGGYVVFIDDKGNHLHIPSKKNCLTLIRNPESFYVKYVNCLSKGNRTFLFGKTNRKLKKKRKTTS